MKGSLLKPNNLPYARHYIPLLIRNRSWILTIHKARILRKKPLEKTFFYFKKWVKSIQTAGYNGARTVFDKKSLPFSITFCYEHFDSHLAFKLMHLPIYKYVWKYGIEERNYSKHMEAHKSMVGRYSNILGDPNFLQCTYLEVLPWHVHTSFLLHTYIFLLNFFNLQNRFVQSSFDVNIAQWGHIWIFSNFTFWRLKTIKVSQKELINEI